MSRRVKELRRLVRRRYRIIGPLGQRDYQLYLRRAHDKSRAIRLEEEKLVVEAAINSLLAGVCRGGIPRFSIETADPQGDKSWRTRRVETA